MQDLEFLDLDEWSNELILLQVLKHTVVKGKLPPGSKEP
jgi:hypothetical protein